MAIQESRTYAIEDLLRSIAGSLSDQSAQQTENVQETPAESEEG